MRVIALKDNKTLRIRKNKQYEALNILKVDLLLVENEAGDSVIMSKYDFQSVE